MELLLTMKRIFPQSNYLFILVVALLVFSGCTSERSTVNINTVGNDTGDTTVIQDVDNTKVNVKMNEFANKLIIAQKKYGPDLISFIDIYAVGPDTQQASKIFTIFNPDPATDLASGPYNSFGNNESLQWSSDGGYAIFRVEQNQGPGTDNDGPHFVSFYKYNNLTQQTDLIYTATNEVFSSWLLVRDSIYFVEGNAPFYEFDAKTVYLLTEVNVTNKEKQSVMIGDGSEFSIGYEDEMVLSQNGEDILWVGQARDTTEYFLYQFNTKSQKISRHGLGDINNAVTANISHSNLQYAYSASFLGKAVAFRNLQNDQVSKLEFDKEINNGGIPYSLDDTKIFVTFRNNVDGKINSAVHEADVAEGTLKLLIADGHVLKVTDYGVIIESDNKLYIYDGTEVNMVKNFTVDGLIAGIASF